MQKSERLIFRRPTKEDFQRYYEINSDPKTNLFNPYGAMDRKIANEVFSKILLHWEEKSFGVWAIAEIDNPAYVIGFGGLAERLYGEDIKLNLGFRFDAEYWGRGYATSLASIAIDYGRTVLEGNEIFALVRPLHHASIRVLEKSGMTLYDRLYDVEGQDPSLVYRRIL